jgi:hypothetical protein
MWQQNGIYSKLVRLKPLSQSFTLKRPAFRMHPPGEHNTTRILKKIHLPPDFGHTRPAVTKYIIFLQPKNPWPGPPGHGAPEERPRPHAPTTSGHGRRPSSQPLDAGKLRPLKNAVNFNVRPRLTLFIPSPWMGEGHRVGVNILPAGSRPYPPPARGGRNKELFPVRRLQAISELVFGVTPSGAKRLGITRFFASFRMTFLF